MSNALDNYRIIVYTPFLSHLEEFLSLFERNLSV